MRIDKVHIRQFKNLRDFDVDLDQNEMYTVLLGQNAAGKSNFLEALVIIFRDLDLNHDPEFSYQIHYRNGRENHRIEIYAVHDAKEAKDRYRFRVNGVDLTHKKFQDNKRELLPRYLIAYYSGLSNRLEEHFNPHQKIFYRELLKGEDDPLRPLFYARLIHSNFVLMSFFSFPEKGPEKKIESFLKEYFGIEGLDSILFVVKRPNWAGSKERMLIEDGDISFWRAKGTVSDLLAELYKIALAPIQDSLKVPIDFRRDETQERVYLYISNMEKLRALAARYGDNVNFFKVLESTYISDFVEDVRIRVRKRNAEGDITFKEMSEGEQQLIMVLGLLRFTKSDDSLILLDEPDTHLNPLWKWQYINLLRDIVDKPDSTQIIMTTHDPLVIGGLRKEEIRIFYQNQEGQISTFEPDEDPRGKGVASILTSNFFGLPTTLDPDSQKDLSKRRSLEIKRSQEKLTPDEEVELTRLEAEWEGSKNAFYITDPLYQKFLNAISQHALFQKLQLTKEERMEQDRLGLAILEEILQEEENQK